MIVKKARILLKNETTIGNYIRILGCEATIYEKTDGNYVEIISKIHDKYEQAKDVYTNELIYDEHSILNEEFKINPNTTLTEFYQSIGIDDYTLTFIEPLTTI